MSPDDLAKEHLTIALYCRNRVFPSLDEFQVAHKLHVSVDGAVFCMIASRLMEHGNSKEDLVFLLESLAAAKSQYKKPEEIVVSPETVEIAVQKSADILQFVPRK